MKINKVRANAWYTFRPVMMDQSRPAHQGLQPGDKVQVKNLRGAPKCNTMGHAHVVDKDGKFRGLVHCNSLVREEVVEEGKYPEKKVTDSSLMRARTLYAQTYAANAKTVFHSKAAEANAYAAVLNKLGKNHYDALKAYHKKNLDATKGVNDALDRGIAEDVVMEHVVELSERLKASDPASKWITDFVKSDDPRFNGKTKEERIKMALGAYYSKAKKNEAVAEGYYSDLIDRAEEEKPKLRLISTHKSSDGKKVAKVYKDKDWDEHRVKFYVDGVHQKDADHHSDKEDAQSTAKHWVNEDVVPIKGFSYGDDTSSQESLSQHFGLQHTSGKMIKIGDTVKLRSKPHKVTGFELPHHEGSSGRVHLHDPSGRHVSYFPGVIDSKIVGTSKHGTNWMKKYKPAMDESITDPSPKDLKTLKAKIAGKTNPKGNPSDEFSIPTIAKCDKCHKEHPPEWHRYESVTSYIKNRNVVSEGDKQVSKTIKNLKLSKANKKNLINTKPTLEVNKKC